MWSICVHNIAVLMACLHCSGCGGWTRTHLQVLSSHTQVLFVVMYCSQVTPLFGCSCFQRRLLGTGERHCHSTSQHKLQLIHAGLWSGYIFMFLQVFVGASDA
jgi:hypothetical protein